MRRTAATQSGGVDAQRLDRHARGDEHLPHALGAAQDRALPLDWRPAQRIGGVLVAAGVPVRA